MHTITRGAACTVSLLGALLPALAAADGGVTLIDVAAGDQAGITYRRVPSASKAIFDAIKNDPPYTQEKIEATPMKSHGAPGVAIFDYDRDGDLDLYVTNGPGAANSLYSNQLRESGELRFVDVATAAGVDATDQDSTGVCFGDVDNDGDHDLLVLSHNSPDRLFENQGDGTFLDVTAASGIAASGVRVSSSCSFGDVDNDGLLDVVIANTYDNWDHYRGINVEPFALNQHNQLFVNQGGNVFADASASSGIEELAGFPPEAAGAAGLTWAIAMVDVDLDGDVDVMAADDQAGIPPASSVLGVDRGMLHLWRNDGSGQLTDRAAQAGILAPGAWMGLAFADFNCDGNLDFFASNFGDYTPAMPILEQPSRWFLGQHDGIFTDIGVGDLGTTLFGWGVSAVDYDNDGDTDVIYHGGLDVGPGLELSNGGVVLQNPDCSARFTVDFDAVPGFAANQRRVVHGMATGDLDQNGFVDVVSVANMVIPESIALTPHQPLGSPFDPIARFFLSFDPDPKTGELVWNGSTFDDGTLAVEISSGGNGNGWVEITLLGTIGLAAEGRVNRDGIGAVVRFRPAAGRWVMKPVLGGSSYASQDALPLLFGLGQASSGTVDVLWPGGVRNRFYGVRAGERLVLPEIPCSYADAGLSVGEYRDCVRRALDDLEAAGVVDRTLRRRLLSSALRALRAERTAGPGGHAGP